MTPGLAQIGWCTLQTPFNADTGVGDDETSYAYDGNRRLKWHIDKEMYGEIWGAGDVIGTLIDFERQEITFYRNGKSLGVAFNKIKTGPNCAYFPAISLGMG